MRMEKVARAVQSTGVLDMHKAVHAGTDRRMTARTGLLWGGVVLLLSGAAAGDTRRLGPAMDLAEAPVPKVASQAAREAFDRARQSLQRVRALNQAANARRSAAGEGKNDPAKPNARPIVRKPAKQK